MARFFGEDGSKKLSLSEFKAFLRELQQRLLIMEFLHYDHNHSGVITGRDFARSLIASADVRIVDNYLDKVSSMDAALGNRRFNQEEFLSFFTLVNYTHLLRTGARFFQQVRGPLGKAEFAGLVQKICGGLVLPDSQLEIIFHLFGRPCGTLDINAFLDCLARRRRANMLEWAHADGADSGSGQLSVLRCLQDCMMG
ncbi:unnamed protein product [Ostreobium quekettii]|uniref:Uncharacterized protein n=1 Tax=Ostreobium quekettii TaxID=121088 RepID=A0A8S1ILT0_9CHLO|nr:unnamed protein product [Ostreobium quekettii]|eukprot:evm.model.scf_2936EXC.2 EVM.evm.TU.scf_2936EXC.2   scf_2936EXC:12880-14279(-)